MRDTQIRCYETSRSVNDSRQLDSKHARAEPWSCCHQERARTFLISRAASRGPRQERRAALQYALAQRRSNRLGHWHRG